MDVIYLCIQQTWVLSKAGDLIMRIVVEAYCAEQSHSAIDTTSELFQRTYWWPEMNVDLKAFMQTCLHCIISRNDDDTTTPSYSTTR